MMPGVASAPQWEAEELFVSKFMDPGMEAPDAAKLPRLKVGKYFLCLLSLPVQREHLGL